MISGSWPARAATPSPTPTDAGPSAGTGGPAWLACAASPGRPAGRRTRVTVSVFVAVAIVVGVIAQPAGPARRSGGQWESMAVPSVRSFPVGSGVQVRQRAAGQAVLSVEPLS